MQPTLFSSVHLTVSQLTFYIRKQLENDPTLQDAWVEGEISNLSRPASGHIYFTLKDKGASLRCMMWKQDAARLRVNLQDGMAVEAHGKITVYEPQGSYQLAVNVIQPKGEGALYQEFLRLKSMLEAEGLFDEERKRPIPDLPRLIGIVTSGTGAALRDMLNTLRRRLPLARVILAPSPVQGVEAPPALVNALNSINKQKPDVILLARGGGSIEDLWAFNDERVVRAVAGSRSPVICGVGHETDFTLSDFAADLRAPTPTAAAELASAITILDLQAQLGYYTSRITDLTVNLLAEQKASVSDLTSRLKYVSPERQIQSEAQTLDELSRRASSALTHRLELQARQVDGVSKRLGALNPAGILARGYAIITRKDDGVVVTRVGQAQGGMTVRVSDGEFEVEAKNKK
ncbi:MAG: exodeoxyribonuclease VII large subunit [Anaerolineales bacterium]|nr:exodeoxyribonuclease VII large subunit [Anaerolineales bacterium]MBP6208929.1 exodeoxyribonuclease VII large subunit [Anaerolineales bacterium]MBP8164470.1 exodeoxyribonuclease VII large subunit [Anaerolineales bacterium]